MDDRRWTAVVATIATAVALIVLLNLTIHRVYAGDIEADVITNALAPLWAVDDITAVTPEQWDLWVADAADIYGDTRWGNCATYAAITTSFLANLRDGVDGGRQWQWDAAWATFYNLNLYQSLCRNEI